MKWREPWAVSLKQQRPFNLFGREVLVGVATWTVVLALLGIVLHVVSERSIQIERIANLWVAPAVGVPLAVFIYVIGWLSPRCVDSGPNGIVVTKAGQLTLIPWGSIRSYEISHSDGHNLLQLECRDGSSHRLHLADSVLPSGVERELIAMAEKHPNISLKRTNQSLRD